jgi:hypothetical protein
VSALQDSTVYLAHDRFVCAQVGCCGRTAQVTGFTTGGYPLTRVTPEDVAAWPVAELGLIVCQCGSVTA